MMPDPLSGTARLEREVRLHKRLRELLLLFSRGVSSNLGLTAPLQALIPEISDILGASRVEIWLHDRRNRQLFLAAASEGRPVGDRVSIEDAAHYAAGGLRLDRARLRQGCVAAPLRGWRRALGTLIVERRPAGKGRAKAADLDDHAFVEFAHELARQLSAGIENIQLLQELLRQRRLLEDTFNSLVDLVVVVDKDLQIVQTNEAFAARVGHKRPDVMHRPLGELVGAETLGYVETGDPAVQQRVDDPQLEGTFLLTATPLTSQDGNTLGRVLVARDITRQTRLEAERAALHLRLTQSEKLASLGQFVAGIAHEMNNPLQGVMGHLELLIEMNEQARPLRRDLKLIFQEADRAAKIVRNLLVFTGSHRVARRSTQVDRILSRAIASRKTHLARADIRLVRTQGEQLPAVLCDPLHLQQAFLNILINAEHAVTEGGRSRRIDVTTSTTRARTHVNVTFRDHGPGIPAAVMPRLFDPFFTTKEVGQGTGLGLAITYGIVQEHGGTIAASNAPDGGAIFEVELPAAPKVVK
jgi:C4-dicarboxylate-specific signal transduction histidine kinase